MSRQLLSSWITLPDSKYGIDYSLQHLTAKRNKLGVLSNLLAGVGGGPTTRPPLRLIRNNRGAFPTPRAGESITFPSSGNDGPTKKKTRQNPFEVRLQCLTTVVQRSNYPAGTGLLYIREIFEPEDPEFDFLEADVNVSQLTQEQVDRLQIMIVPKRREDVLRNYLDFHEAADRYPQHGSSSESILRHFEGFKRRYVIATTVQDKFDLLFGFSFSIKTHSGWMYLHETETFS